MLKKSLKYILSLVVLLFVAWNSVFFKKLDEVKASRIVKQFDAVGYADTFWHQKLIPNVGKAVDVITLAQEIGKDTTATFKEYSHALGIGNLRYFLVSGTGKVTGMDDNYVYIMVKNGAAVEQPVKVAIEYIFGNAVRDASGYININEFKNTMDFNNISAAINDIIRKDVLLPFKKNVQVGDVVHFTGALELNRKHLKLDSFEIIPVKLDINKAG